MSKFNFWRHQAHYILIITSLFLMNSCNNSFKDNNKNEISSYTIRGNDNINAIIDEAIKEGKAVHITYQKKNGVRSERTISKIKYTKVCGKNGYINAYCHLRNDYRTFKIGRIKSAKIE